VGKKRLLGVRILLYYLIKAGTGASWFIHLQVAQTQFVLGINDFLTAQIAVNQQSIFSSRAFEIRLLIGNFGNIILTVIG